MHRIHSYMPSCPESLSPSMPTIRLSNMSTSLYKKPAHRWNDSGELDVFEATKYFSGTIDGLGFSAGAMKKERMALQAEKKIFGKSTQGMLAQEGNRVEKHNKDKRCKQPSSPAARLASFLNSFFNQTSSKRRSKRVTITSSTNTSWKDKVELSLGGSNSSSSLSYSQSMRSSDSKSIYSCASSGLRTPSIYPSSTPIKVHKQSRYPNYKCHVQTKSVTFCQESKGWEDGRITDVAWLAEKRKHGDGFFDKNKVVIDGYLKRVGRLHAKSGIMENKWVLKKASDGIVRSDTIWVDEFTSKGRKSLRRTEEVEVDAESDTSSDLFELNNFDLGHPSSGLPVWDRKSGVQNEGNCHH